MEMGEFASSRVRLLNTIIKATPPPPAQSTAVGSQLTLLSETDLQKTESLAGSHIAIEKRNGSRDFDGFTRFQT
jgi:hypothetical protein